MWLFYAGAGEGKPGAPAAAPAGKAPAAGGKTIPLIYGKILALLALEKNCRFHANIMQLWLAFYSWNSSLFLSLLALSLSLYFSLSREFVVVFQSKKS